MSVILRWAKANSPICRSDHSGQPRRRKRGLSLISILISILSREGSALAFGLGQGHRRGGALAPPLLLVDHFAEEVELDGDVVRVLEQYLEQLRVREAAEVHRDLVLLDALAHRARVLGEEGDVIDRAGAGGPLRVLLQQEHVADPVGILRGEVDADLVADLEPVAWKAEVRALGELHAQNFAVEVPGALEVLRDDEVVVQSGNRHGGSFAGSRNAYFPPFYSISPSPS